MFKLRRATSDALRRIGELTLMMASLIMSVAQHSLAFALSNACSATSRSRKTDVCDATASSTDLDTMSAGAPPSPFSSRPQLLSWAPLRVKVSSSEYGDSNVVWHVKMKSWRCVEKSSSLLRSPRVLEQAQARGVVGALSSHAGTCSQSRINAASAARD